MKKNHIEVDKDYNNVKYRPADMANREDYVICQCSFAELYFNDNEEDTSSQMYYKRDN